MKKTVLVLIPIVSLVTACGGIPSISEGPRADENLLIALNEVNFINYIVQSKQRNAELGEYYTIATISPQDLSFKTKTKQLLFTTEHSSYYFDKVDDSYDIYYKDKLNHNQSYLGNSYYGRYNKKDHVEQLPNLESIFSYYHVHNLTQLNADNFTYSTHLNGWYLLNEEAYSAVVTDFFGLDESYSLHHFNLQVVSNKVRSIEYKLVDSSNNETTNELFYTYPMDFLQDSQFSLINTVKVSTVEENIMTPNTNEPSIDEEPGNDETPSDETSESVLVDKIDFSIYDDGKLFGDGKYTISSIQLFENYDYETKLDTPIAEISRGGSHTVSARQLTLDRRLVRGNRYLLRINLGETPDGASSDYYDYAWMNS